MSWSKLAPIAKTTGRPMASASIVVNKDGAPKISLILSASLKDEFGDPKRADILAGEGEHSGSLLIEFRDDGAFEIKRFVHGGARIFIPVPAGLPDKPAAWASCTLGPRTRAQGELVVGDTPASCDSLVFRLPVEAWSADISQRLAPPRREPSPVAPAAAKPANSGLDVVDYLRSRGDRIDRLADNRFQLNGQVITAGQALKAVNDYRKAADLDPLTAAQVR